MTKDDIRQEISKRKKSFQSLELLSELIVKKFQSLELFQQAKTIGAYMPLPDEPDIRPLFDLLEKTFYIPAFDAVSQRPSTLRGGGYRLAKLTSELQKGTFGILEPVNPVFAPEKLDLIIVPGVAFDDAGNRLGRGGGFYDRLLPQYQAVRAGVCFSFQTVETIPIEPHDYPVNLVVTHQGIQTTPSRKPLSD